MIDNNCIICLENNNLIKYPCYYNNCKCIYYVHKNCIYNWNLDHNYCLICKKKYNYKFINIIHLFNFLFIIIFTYIYISIHPFNNYNFNYTTL